MLRVNGKAIEDYYKLDVLGNAYNFLEAHPRCHRAICNGTDQWDFIVNDNLVYDMPFYLFKTNKFKALDPHGHLTTVYGALWKMCYWYFDGTDDYMLAGDHAEYNITDNLTVEVLAYPARLVGDQTLVSRSFQAGDAPFNVRFEAGLVNFHTYVAGVKEINCSCSALGVDTWHHIVATFDQSLASDNAKLYLNANLEAADDYNSPLPTISQDLHIGQHGPAGKYQGGIAVARIYHQTFTQAEIDHHYEVLSGRAQPNL